MRIKSGKFGLILYRLKPDCNKMKYMKINPFTLKIICHPTILNFLPF